jgi:hypothetical protein
MREDALCGKWQEGRCRVRSFLQSLHGNAVEAGSVRGITSEKDVSKPSKVSRHR